MKNLKTYRLGISSNRLEKKSKQNEALHIQLPKVSQLIDSTKKNSVADINHDRISIPNDNGFYLVPIKDIIRLEGWQRYTKIYVEGKGEIISSLSIGSYSGKLKRYNFTQSHKSHLVNPAYIDKYNYSGELLLINGDRVPISRRKRHDVLNFLKAFFNMYELNVRPI